MMKAVKEQATKYTRTTKARIINETVSSFAILLILGVDFRDDFDNLINRTGTGGLLSKCNYRQKFLKRC